MSAPQQPNDRRLQQTQQQEQDALSQRSSSDSAGSSRPGFSIRIVPYTPPRVSSDGSQIRVPSYGSSASTATAIASAPSGSSSRAAQPPAPPQPSGNDYDNAVLPERSHWTRGMGDGKEGYASSQGSALPPFSPASAPSRQSQQQPRSLVTAQGPGGVSGTKLGAFPGDPSAPPGSRSASDDPGNTRKLNAQPSQEELQHHHYQQQHDDDHGPASPTGSDATASPQPQSRPVSRRRNFIAVHSDKTFSLVPKRPSSELEAAPLSAASVSAASASGSGSASGGFKSPPLSFSSRRTSSSHDRDRPSLDAAAWSDDHPSSPWASTSVTSASVSATIPDPASPSPLTPSLDSPTVQLSEDPIASSPWNYRMVGGLRKVPKTPDLKQKQVHALAESPLPPLPEISVSAEVEDAAPPSPPSPTHRLAPKQSFGSEVSASTTSDKTNYKLYGQPSSPNYKVYGEPSSPAQVSTDSFDPPPSSSHSHTRLLPEPSSSPPLLPVIPADLTDSSRPGSSDFDGSENYILHGDPSPLPSSAANSPRKEPRVTYSQESLVVPPLKPFRPKRSHDGGFGYYKQRSRESLRAQYSGRTNSLKSISSVISQEPAQSIIVSPALINLGGGASGSSSGNNNNGQQRPQQQQQQQQQQQPQQQDTWAAQRSAGGPSSSPSPYPHGSLPPSSLPPSQRAQMIQSTPHQWSSQLSTVMSESEAGSSEPPSRSVSALSGSLPAGSAHGRHSSTGWASSRHSRQVQSISSSLAGQLEEYSSSGNGHHSRGDSIDRPQPTYGRGGPSGNRMVRDQDEHGDGLADLHSVSQQASRSGLSGFFTSSSSSNGGRGLHSSASSRSLNMATIPAWARVYYGSGERRGLAAPSISSMSESGESRPGSSAFPYSSSPNTDHFPLSIYSPRRRAKEVHPHPGNRPFSSTASLELGPNVVEPSAGPSGMAGGPRGPGDYYTPFRSIRRMTSSIWSPHLATDRRATRYSMWEPPSVSWSAESGIVGRRNVQIVLFAVGFALPFAWMVAAFLPLPPGPTPQMKERDHSDDPQQMDFTQNIRLIDERRYASARWWRNLNRVLSVVGLLVIGAVIALVVVGVKQGWMVR